MTILYKPVQIETVEQAEALPVGTTIECIKGLLYGVAPHRKLGDGAWFGGSGGKLSADLYIEASEDVRCVWVALVPIEAEEETRVVVRAAGSLAPERYPYAEASMDSDGNVWFGDGLNKIDVTDGFNEWAKKHTRTRYVTPWEES